MRRDHATVAMTLVAFVLGALLVVQFRAQTANSGLDALSAQDLTALIANVNAGNDELRAEVAGLSAQLQELDSTAAAGRSNVSQLQAELQRIRIWAGLDAARGRGLVITVSGAISPNGLNDLLDELRLAGAEAIAVEATRIVPGAAIGGTVGHLTLEGRPLPTPVTVTAIGDPANLQAILARPGGAIGQIVAAQPSVVFDIQPSQSPLQVPAADRSLVPADAKPHV